jgi:acetyl esterase/lipase
MKKLWSGSDGKFMTYLMALKYLGRGNSKELYFARQTVWSLGKDGKLVHRVGETSSNQESSPFVKVLYIHYGKKSESPKDSVVFHCHGGGFISMTPKGHEGYLRQWSKHFNVPVISVFYRLAPEDPYPAALQDLLDAYFFLTSQGAEVILGFRPKNIVIAGDSAGGNLATALTIVLNDVKKRDETLLMPRSVCIQYPVANPYISVTASRTLSVLDNLLTLGARYAVSAGYVGETFDFEHRATISTGIKPWYRREEETINGIFEKHRQKLADPYFNVLSFNSYEELKDIKLYVQASEFDPLLDDSIDLCRRWKGFVQLDVIPDVNHGFLAFQGFCPEARSASQVTLKRIGEGLGVTE